jgi:glutamate:GABA antiporter
MAEAGPLPPLETAAAAREKAKLRKVLGRFDLVLFTACAILGFDTVAASAQAGAQAVTWLLISLVIFLIPYGMLTAELGSSFPVEGGPYEWARLAFGRLAGSVTAILYWLSNPTWIGGTLTASTIATLDGGPEAVAERVPHRGRPDGLPVGRLRTRQRVRGDN